MYTNAIWANVSKLEMSVCKSSCIKMFKTLRSECGGAEKTIVCLNQRTIAPMPQKLLLAYASATQSPVHWGWATLTRLGEVNPTNANASEESVVNPMKAYVSMNWHLEYEAKHVCLTPNKCEGLSWSEQWHVSLG